MKVRVRTPSRLHFSMVDLRGDLGRIFGSVGVAIDRPNIVIEAEPAPLLTVTGFRAERAREFAETVLEESGVTAGAKVSVVSDMPEHSGFGSGTQLALGVGTAISEIHGLDHSPERLALLLNRSRRSGVGTYAFKHGGFIVDGGHRVGMTGDLPPLIFRHDLPQDWLFVIGLPDAAQGSSGKLEIDAFRNLEPPPTVLAGDVSRILLMQMIPALLEGDAEAFGSAMTSLDLKFGEHWSEVQGGLYSSPVIEEGVEFLLEKGALGAGQSSWGPAFYGLVRGERQAEDVRSQLDGFLNEGSRSGTAFVAHAQNEGAEVKVTE
jgi:beta-ribofuranosylaminobenzene 5'-phosphate synthase